jgi:2-phospho-L-lactate/phosphoenolpyruvate guanylyltransferase
MTPHIVIPCKALSQGKSRLSGRLGATARRELCTGLLRHTLQLALAIQHHERVLVISPDPEAAAIARSHTVRVAVDEGVSLNDALRHGRAWIAQHDLEGMSGALILPIDLVRATPAALAQLIRSDLDLVIVPDERSRGTNVLYLGPGVLGTFPFAYGANSFMTHCRWAERHGVRFQAVLDPLLGFDLDDPEAYDRWQRMRRTGDPPQTPWPRTLKSVHAGEGRSVRRTIAELAPDPGPESEIPSG